MIACDLNHLLSNTELRRYVISENRNYLQGSIVYICFECGQNYAIPSKLVVFILNTYIHTPYSYFVRVILIYSNALWEN